jgi:hypothetical protein
LKPAAVWAREAMSDDPYFEYLIVDSTIVQAHQHAAGAKDGAQPLARNLFGYAYLFLSEYTHANRELRNGS